MDTCVFKLNELKNLCKAWIYTYLDMYGVETHEHIFVADAPDGIEFNYNDEYVGEEIIHVNGFFSSDNEIILNTNKGKFYLSQISIEDLCIIADKLHMEIIKS